MKKIYFTFILMSLCGLTFAQSVTYQEAETVAQRFLESQGKTLVRCAKTVECDGSTLLFIFNAENGFVVVAGDKSTQPILSFSDHQLYSESDVVPPFTMWINHYASQIEQIKKQHVIQPEFVSRWEEILAGAPVFRSGDEVEPLMHSQWDQDDYYNYYCPRDPAGRNGRAVTGCVATAMGQLLYYFRFPEHGTGSYSYTDENYGVQSADYEHATYDYNAMCDKPTAINTEISELIYHCGVGVDMHYGPNGSGMTNHSAARVLRTYFKFSPETEYLFRDSTDLNWDSVIVSHLNRKIPMYYAGWSEPNIDGHGFICDGYKMVDSSYFFHFNFGWSGYMDNYYYTNSLFVNNSNFNLAQELIVNGYPDTTQYAYPTPQPLTGSLTLTSGESTFTDGGPAYEHCSAGMDFTWNIEPEVSNITGISLSIHYDLADGDTLYVFSDVDYFNGFALTGDTGTFHLDLNTPSLQVRLVTHSASSAGFRAHYTANQEVFCSSYQVFTHVADHIEDGSGEADYNNLSNCYFRIMAASRTAYFIHVNRLDLEEEKDFLRFYDNTISNDRLLLTLTGHLSDTTFIVNVRRLTIVFETDETGTADGFDLDYEAGYVGLTDYEDLNLSIYPNPSSDYINVNASSPIQVVELFNVDGRKVYSTTPCSEEITIPLFDLPAGIYLMTLRSGDQIFKRKIVKL